MNYNFKMKGFILHLSLVICIFVAINEYCYAQEDSNFTRILLNNNCSLELPVSWKKVTSANQDLNEISQAAHDNIAAAFNSNNTGNNKTEFFAYKNNFKGSHASVLVAFNESMNCSQKDISSLNASERSMFCDQVKAIAVKGMNPVSCTVSIMQHNEIYACIIKSVDDKGNQQIVVQIPIGTKALTLTFDAKLSEISDWNPIFLKIMNSIQIPQ